MLSVDGFNPLLDLKYNGEKVALYDALVTTKKQHYYDRLVKYNIIVYRPMIYFKIRKSLYRQYSNFFKYMVYYIY